MGDPLSSRRALWRDGPALLFTMFFPVIMAWVYFIVLANDRTETNWAILFAYGATRAIMFLFPLLYVWWFEPGEIRPHRPDARGLGWGLGFGALVAATIAGAYFGWLRHSPLLERTPEMIYRRIQQIWAGGGPFEFILIGLFISVIHSLFEEYYWRWFVFGRLRLYLPLAAAIIVSAVGFSLHHVVILYVYFPGNFWLLAIPFAAAVGVGGAVWAWIYARSGSLYAPWLSHMLVDAALMGVGFAMLLRFWRG